MPGTGLKNLAWPDDAYRVDLLDPTFETVDEKIEEQEDRRCLLTEAAAMATFPENRAQALLLAKRLDTSLASPRERCSSPIYLRDMKVRIAGALLKLVASGEGIKLVAVGIIPCGRWRVKPGDLRFLDARKQCRALRAALRRAGSKGSDGGLLVFIEGEYNPRTGLIDLHFHGFAFGRMVDVVDRLRDLRTYRGDRSVHIQRNLTNLPHLLTYPLKFWKSRYRDEDGRAGKPARIPEPAHSQVLLWLDRYPVADLSVMIGLRVGRDGQLVATNPCTDQTESTSKFDRYPPP